MNSPPANRRAYIDRFVDTASVINTIAASAVIQHQDYGAKNYDLILSDQGLWQITPTDFDLTFGWRYDFGCGGLCDPVLIGGAFEHPGQPLFAALWFDPEFALLIRQRIRTLTRELFDADAIGARVGTLADVIAPIAAADRAIWGTYGSSQTSQSAAGELMADFVIPQEARLLGPLVRQGRVSGIDEPVGPNIVISDVQYDEVGGRPAHVIVTNRAASASTSAATRSTASTSSSPGRPSSDPGSRQSPSTKTPV